MTDINAAIVRLECLRLASQGSESPYETLWAAKDMFDYVLTGRHPADDEEDLANVEPAGNA